MWYFNFHVMSGDRLLEVPWMCQWHAARLVLSRFFHDASPLVMIPHFLPFFFFFPPVAAGAPGAGVPPILTSPLSSTFGVDMPSPLPAGALRSSNASGSAAISLPSLPRFPISLPTSAALLVSYCRHVPDSGSYVLSVNVVVGSSGFCDCGGGDEVRVVSLGLSDCFAKYFWRFLIFEAEGLLTAYLEVMRVCSSSQSCRVRGDTRSIPMSAWP